MISVTRTRKPRCSSGRCRLCATLRGDYTPYWEDGAASTSLESPYGQGLIIRLYNPTDEPQKTTLSFAAPQIRQEKYAPLLYRSNPLEDRLEKLSEPTLIIPARDFVTLRAE